MSAQSFKSRWQKALGEDERLDVYDVAVGLTYSISARADGTFPEDWHKRPSIRTLGRRAGGIDKKTVNDRLVHLEDLGWLRFHEWSKGRKTHLPQLQIPLRTGDLGSPVEDDVTGDSGSSVVSNGNRGRENAQPGTSTPATGDELSDGTLGVLRTPLDMVRHGVRFHVENDVPD